MTGRREDRDVARDDAPEIAATEPAESAEGIAENELDEDADRVGDDDPADDVGPVRTAEHEEHSGTDATRGGEPTVRNPDAVARTGDAAARDGTDRDRDWGAARQRQRERLEPGRELGEQRGSALGRLAALGLGGVLLSYGLERRRSLRGAGATLLGGALAYRGIAGHGVLSRATRGERGRSRRQPGASPQATTVRRSITVDAPAEELEAYWLDPGDLSRIAGDYAEVHGVADDRIRAVVRGPMGWQRSWQLQLAEHEPGERVTWESTPAASVSSELTVLFHPAPGDRGTEVAASIRWDPPGGRLGAAAIEHLGVGTSPMLGTVLRRFQSLAETGEVPTLEGNPSGRSGGNSS